MQITIEIPDELGNII